MKIKGFKHIDFPGISIEEVKETMKNEFEISPASITAIDKTVRMNKIYTFMSERLSLRIVMSKTAKYMNIEIYTF